jgi:hypothetical protein
MDHRILLRARGQSPEERGEGELYHQNPAICDNNFLFAATRERDSGTAEARAQQIVEQKLRELALRRLIKRTLSVFFTLTGARKTQ